MQTADRGAVCVFAGCVPKEEVVRVFLQIAQLPEVGQASDKAIPPRSSCRQDQKQPIVFGG